ncbi:acyltransferase [Mucilaginibacter corticis]|uniref:Acyltransferase n=1 Tax=Mucilaginibacter corticis TaxID=2597670 RepID=A0A556MKA4_9SPHI|nr:acyltransferase [Mucilaginibacter corticis]TSJ40327.1 acyltransferase [Mucilaginibacter corticis]
MRIEQLTFTRFIAALGIVIFHFGKGVFPFDHGVLFILINHFNVAVSYFFCLSGFVMVVAYSNGDKQINTKNYYINRVAKIYPVYILALALMLFSLKDINYLQLAAEALLLHTVIPPYVLSYNLPDWSLSVELFFYLLFPLIYNRVYLGSSLKKTALWVIGFWVISQVACFIVFNITGPVPAYYDKILFYGPLTHLNEFLMGNLFGFIYLQWHKKGYFKNDLALSVCFMLLMVGCLLLPLLKSTGFQPVANFHNGLLAILFGPFILLLALNNGYISRFLSMRLFVYLGEISYCVYILQYPVFSILNRVIKFQNQAVNLYLITAVLLVCSMMVYQLVELPGKQLLKKVLKP